MGDDLASAWHLQTLLLRAGLLPRTLRTDEIGSLADEPVDLVVFDRGVPGAVAIDALARVRPPAGADVPPTLFLSDGGGVATEVRGERRLPAGATDAAIVAAVDELISASAPSTPRVMPAVDDIDISHIVGGRAGVVAFRRRRSPIALGPIAALALVLGAIAGYSALAVDRSVAPTATVAPDAGDAAALALAPTLTEVQAPAPPPGRPHPSPLPEGEGTLASVPPATSATALPTPAAPTATAVPTSTPAPAAPPTAVSGLEGRITDRDTGAGVPGAIVVYRGAAAGHTSTGGDGRYRVDGLPAGAYDLVAVAPGYAPAGNRAGVVVDTVTTDNLALPPASDRVAPFMVVADRRTGMPAAVYGYAVRAGDTLPSIAERAGIAIEEILALNRLDQQEHLEVGRVLYLPASTFGQK